ncbi:MULTISPECIES: hypothetical protein [unclassified Providencia]|uniref:hypothetical protein n=1 Tax=unclassified Providencia TaxID=2633465 RepID=UPI00234987FE|nr:MULTISPECIES: hypothetical protein [unclassified Providencia]
MAVYSNKTNKIGSMNKVYDTKTYSVGEKIEHSGIYECNRCGFNIAMNKHQPTLPPHECKCSNNKYMAFALIKNG